MPKVGFIFTIREKSNRHGIHKILRKTVNYFKEIMLRKKGNYCMISITEWFESFGQEMC